MRGYNLLGAILVLVMSLGLYGCKDSPSSGEVGVEETPWQVDRFGDLRVMRFEVPEWEHMSAQQRVLCYYLSEATLCGRDILWDQNCRVNLPVRYILEAIYRDYGGDRTVAEWSAFEVYLKRVWFSNGIHHHYSSDKIDPGFSIEYFRDLLAGTPLASFPASWGVEGVDELERFAIPYMFDPLLLPKRVNRTQGEDVLLSSAMNYYRGVTQAEAEAYYQGKLESGDAKLPYGMNSQLVRGANGLEERVWRSGGMYGAAIDEILHWLRLAEGVAETEQQRRSIELLIAYYETGDLGTFNDYSIAWVKDTASQVDFVNGFIEDYGDPIGIKCSWEGMVNVRNDDATRRTQIISDNAQWFEDHSPVDPRFRKPQVRGVMAKVISAVMLGGDCYPSSPIGINLPNANWIRAEHGSKSVTIQNLTDAYDKAAQGNGFLEEFAYDEAEIARARVYGNLADNIHTDLHECLGHGSGQLAPGVTGGELLNYSATLEEARADLFALYYIMDPKLVELGVIPSGGEYGQACYDAYMRNGLMTQLARVELGSKIEQDHMRNRSLITHWCYERGKDKGIVEIAERDGKHYVHVRDYEGLRALFGELLHEVQRIKSEGDYAAGQALVETYGVLVDQDIHREVRGRYAALDIAPYGGFVNPVITPVMDGDKVVDAKLEYTTDYAGQMMGYSERYSFLKPQLPKVE